IGFGPKIFKIKKGETEYAVSLIPLGGYVKMFGDDPLNKDSIPVAERDRSFTFQGKWARFWIVMGGPLANFVMAYFIFFSLLMMGEKVPEIRMGIIPKDSSFYEKGLRSGDRVLRVNEKEVFNPTDLMLDASETLKTITVLRGSEEKKLVINWKSDKFFNEFVNYPPALRKPIIVDPKGELYGLSFDSKKIDWNLSLDQISEIYNGEQPLYMYKVVEDKTHPEIGFKQTGNFISKISLPSRGEDSLYQSLFGKNFRPLDLKIESVNIKSPAEKAGIKSGDIRLSLNGKSVASFENLRDSLQEITGDKVTLRLWSDQREKEVVVQPEVKEVDGNSLKLIGVYSAVEYQGIRFIETPAKSFLSAFTFSFTRTWETIVKTIQSFKKLVSNQVSFKTVGGPLSIGKVASDSFNTSISYFFQLMALISVNLGVINLFPIPVLDGGHIMFIILEIINRGPVSRKKMEIAQQFGLSVLLLLMFGALYNDFSRFF
ncbi:MAG: RIP metalloprotease RseP, partial [Bdellovibrionales bacterium]|nr:RIP metalloprotease RseP [Bdellovibrionales bacterium]